MQTLLKLCPQGTAYLRHGLNLPLHASRFMSGAQDAMHCTAEAAPRRKRSRSQENTPALNGDLKRQKSASMPRPGAVLSPKSDLSRLPVSSNVPLHAHRVQAETEPNFTTHVLTSSCDRRWSSCLCATSAAGVRFACQCGAHC